MDLTAALDALYAGFPGGLVIPCLEPVMITAVGVDVELWLKTSGRSAQSPFVIPSVFVLKTFSK